MFNNHSFSERVWRGDIRAISEAQMLYLTARHDDEDAVVAYATVLYSFRYLPSSRSALRGLWPRIEMVGKRLQYLMCNASAHEKSQTFLDRFDTVTTHLFWFLEANQLPQNQKEGTLSLVIDLCTKALTQSKHASDTVFGHTIPLIRLTYISCLVWRGSHWDHGEVASNLELVANSLASVSDTRQRNRVMRKLGTLYRRKGLWRNGFRLGWWATRDLTVPLAVRLKSLVALLRVR